MGKALNFYRLYVEDGAGQSVHTVELLGLKPGVGLIVSAPEGAAFSAGAAAKLSLFYQGGIKTASTKVVMFSQEPFGHLHLEWPRKEAVVKRTQRQGRRAAVDLDATVKGEALGGVRLGAKIENLSAQGAGVVIERPSMEEFAPKRVKLSFAMDLDGDEVSCEAMCEVMRQEPFGEGKIFMGLRFDPALLSKEARLGICALVWRNLAESMEEPLFPM